MSFDPSTVPEQSRARTQMSSRSGRQTVRGHPKFALADYLVVEASLLLQGLSDLKCFIYSAWCCVDFSLVPRTPLLSYWLVGCWVGCYSQRPALRAAQPGWIA